MKKYLLLLSVGSLFIPFMAGADFFSETDTETVTPLTPTVFVQLSPGNKPTQRVNPGENAVELLRIWLTAADHQDGGITLEKIQLKHEGSYDHFLRYKLYQENTLLGVRSLVSDEVIEFKNLNVYLEDGKTAELRVLGDIATHEAKGNHSFSVPHPDFLTIPKNDIRHKETYIKGDFPIDSNRIIIGESFASPSEECNLREEPVCGVDGKTYYNLCIPFYKDIEIDYEGPCYESRESPEFVCSDEINPVCGENGKTYPNECFLEKEETFKKHNGECFPENFQFPHTFRQAVHLLEIKANELRQLRPRISQSTDDRLQNIIAVLKSYNFTAKNTQSLIRQIGEFLEFTQISSTRMALEQQVEILNSVIIDARASSAHEKYKQGEIPFRDVDEHAWFLSAVQFLKEKNYISNFVSSQDLASGFFRPTEFVTKAQVTEVLFDMREIEAFLSPPPQNILARNHWAYNTIAKAEERQLSLWKNHPNPDQKITRFEIVKLILEVFEKDPGRLMVSSFRDVYTPADIPFIEYARNARLVSGYSDGSFRPQKLLTRAEAAQILYNAYRAFQN